MENPAVILGESPKLSQAALCYLGVPCERCDTTIGMELSFGMIFTAQRIGTQGFLTLQTLVISICLPNNPWVTFMEFSGAFWLLVEWYIVTKWGLDKLNSICKDQQMREWLGTLAQDCFDWCFNGNGTPPQEAISQWWGKPFLVSDSTLLSHLGVPCGRSDTTTGMNYYMICYLVWSLQHNA